MSVLPAPMLLTLWITAAPAADIQQLQMGRAALDALRVREAVRHLEKAVEQGPYEHDDHVLLYEQLGIAYAYAGDKKAALDAFEMLLALDPGHAIAYTLSPKVTFLFQKARARAAMRPPPLIELTWPPTIGVADPVPIYVEVMADPKGFLHDAILFARRHGGSIFADTLLRLAPLGEAARIELPAVAPDATAPQSLELYLIARNQSGSQVLRVGDQRFPRQISLAYEAPLAWYQRWWVWSIIGAVVVGVSVATILAVTYTPPQQIGGTLVVK